MSLPLEQRERLGPCQAVHSPLVVRRGLTLPVHSLSLTPLLAGRCLQDALPLSPTHQARPLPPPLRERRRHLLQRLGGLALAAHAL